VTGYDLFNLRSKHSVLDWMVRWCQKAPTRIGFFGRKNL